MSSEAELLRDPLGAVVVGPELFASALGAQGVPVPLDRILSAHQVLIDVRPAIDVVPGMTRETVLHAGPPIAWERMSGPMRGGIVGALIYEGLATTWQDAERLVTSGAVRFDPCHHHATVGPMAGATTASMPVLVVENRTAGNRAYSTVNEGLGKVLRYGAYSPDVIDRLRWFRDVVGPAFGEAIRRAGGVDLRALIGQAVQMGDECHNRNRAASALLIKALAPEIAALDLASSERKRVLAFAASNEHLFLNVGMAACKAALDTAHGVPDSTIVTAMARNGTDFGIRVGGLGDRWFTGPAQTPDGLYFPGFSAGDANPDIGDSAITETGGLGGFAMGGAPAVVQTGILPQIDTGMAHREPGVGQVGAGLVKPPRVCFDRAFEALVQARASASSTPRA